MELLEGCEKSTQGGVQRTGPATPLQSETSRDAEAIRGNGRRKSPQGQKIQGTDTPPPWIYLGDAAAPAPALALGSLRPQTQP